MFDADVVPASDAMFTTERSPVGVAPAAATASRVHSSAAITFTSRILRATPVSTCASGP